MVARTKKNMEIDQLRFINLVMEKTNVKLNELQARVIVLEAQLEIAADMNKQLMVSAEKAKKKEAKSDY